MAYGDDQHVARRLEGISDRLFGEDGRSLPPDPWPGWQDDMSFLYTALKERIPKSV